MAYLRNRASLMSMEEIALQHILLQLWSVGYIFVDAIAIASQTLIAELISKKEKFQKSILQKELISVTTAISFFLAITTFSFLKYFIEKTYGHHLRIISKEFISNIVVLNVSRL